MHSNWLNGIERYFKVDGSMEKKWDTVIPAELKRLFVSGAYTGCIKMSGAVWKLIIFTSVVKRLINTIRNERVTLQVYDTSLQMCDFFGLRRKDCLTRSTLSSDTRGRPALFPLQRHPVV